MITMPCPYFEPQAVASGPQHANARLPLIQEFDGVCHAAAEPFAVPDEHRFPCCNHGYSRARCQHFPSTESRSAFRYTILKQSASVLELVCIEEQDYRPVRWYPTSYFAETGLLEPELADSCMRSQVVAFCRSYLERFRPAI
jgi:hypothetical protein